MITTAPRRPLVRYHGGKWKLAPWIISNFPNHRIYVEPFGGGGSVLLRKPRCYSEVYNDLSGEIVNLFFVCRDHGHDLKKRLQMTPFSREEYIASFAVTNDPVEQARRTVVRSFMGFGSNSLCRSIKSGFRSNSNRSGTTPAHDWRNLPSAMDAIIDRLRGVIIENRPASDVMRANDTPNTLHYCDPPYLHSTRSGKMSGNHGYDYEMTDDDHTRFLDVATDLRGMVVISIYDCDLYQNRLRGWQKLEKKTTADGAKPRTETLYASPNIQWGLFDQ